MASEEEKLKKPFWSDPDAFGVVQTLFGGARVLTTREEVLHFACSQALKTGLFLELGVASGTSIRFLASSFPDQQFYGFDSFEGLPEAWERGDMRVWKGAFRQEHLPSVPSNVQLIAGWFSDTLRKIEEPISFLHIDCDLYSSTKEAFDILGDQIGKGTVIVFDEFYNYPGFEEHEFKAFTEFLEKKALKGEPIAYNAFHEQVAFKV